MPAATVTVTQAPAHTITVVESDEQITITQAPDIAVQTPAEQVVEVVQVGAVGPQGPAGPTGPQGPPGSGGDLTFVHNQSTSSANWAITHNLGKMPSVSVVDTGENMVVGDVQYIDANSVELNFASPFTGKAYLN